ncbi:MAG: hypothetical protein ABW022_00140, partial [Actinoplanes sp.]
MTDNPELPAGVTALATLDGEIADGVAMIAWLSDGRRLATVGDRGDVWSVDEAGAEWRHEVRTGHSPSGRTRFVAGSPTDPLVVAHAMGNRLRLFRGGVPVWDTKYSNDLGLMPAVSFSPDGGRLAVAGTSGKLRLLDAGTGAAETVSLGSLRASAVVWSPVDELLVVSSSENRAVLMEPDGTVVRELPSSYTAKFRWCTWSRGGNWLCRADVSGVIQVYDSAGSLKASLEGHRDTVLAADFSHDDRLLYSVSKDETIRCWRTDSWQCVAVIELPDGHGTIGGLAARPGGPWLARRRENRYVDLFAIDTDRLLGTALARSRTYANAKVVLLGDTGVGKSGLGLVLTGRPYEPTDSTHARQVSTFDDQKVALPDGDFERRETLLWDLAGQPGYRLIHQLHLAEVAAALIVFDARSETDPFAGVRYWARALRQQGIGRNVPALLVAARADRGGVPVSQGRVEALLEELGLAGFFETSAKEGRRIPELIEAVRAAIDWAALPRSVSTELFEQIKEFLLGERTRDRVLATAEDLYRDFLRDWSGTTPPDELRASFDTCVRLLELRDLVRRLSFGGFVLLRPELLDSYASALIDAARSQPDGLGYLSEAAALAGEFAIPAECRLPAGEERLLLIAMVEELLRHDVALRETTDGGVDLVFPSQLTADGPDAPGPEAADLVFRYDGAVRTVYATLVVRLAHVTAYRRKEMWRNAATFRAVVGGRCGVRVREYEEGRGELTVFFDGEASEETRFLFEEYVHAHLTARGLPGSVRRERVFTCSGCGYRLPGDVVRLRQERGRKDTLCPVCEEVRISLLDRELRLPSADEVRVMNENADAGRDQAVATATIRGKEETQDYDVFLSYHSQDRAAVLEIAGRLRGAGVLP